MSQTDTVEREREHTVDRGVTNAELAKLDEETKTKLQIEEIHRRTVEPGLMRLSVSRVSASEENKKVVIDVEHPLEGELRFHMAKPTTWDPDNELVQFLDDYDTSISGIYELQTHDVYVRHDPTQMNDWRLVAPPSPTPRRYRLAGALRERVPSVTSAQSAFLTISYVGAATVTSTAWLLGELGSASGLALPALLVMILGLVMWTAVLFVAGGVYEHMEAGVR